MGMCTDTYKARLHYKAGAWWMGGRRAPSRPEPSGTREVGPGANSLSKPVCGDVHTMHAMRQSQQPADHNQTLRDVQATSASTHHTHAHLTGMYRARKDPALKESQATLISPLVLTCRLCSAGQN